MAELIDLEEVQKNCAVTRETYLKNRELPGEDGALARLGADCDPAMTIWRAREANRHTDPNDVINALIRGLVAHIAAEVLNHGKGEVLLSAGLSISVTFSEVLFKTMAAANAGAFKMESIPAREVGTA